jgi:hypothetical protein
MKPEFHIRDYALDNEYGFSADVRLRPRQDIYSDTRERGNAFK